METIGTFFNAVWTMESNTGIVSFVTNNAILIGILIIFGNGLARSTPWAWDNIMMKTIRNSLSFVKPDFDVPNGNGNNGTEEPKTTEEVTDAEPK